MAALLVPCLIVDLTLTIPAGMPLHTFPFDEQAMANPPQFTGEKHRPYKGDELAGEAFRLPSPPMPSVPTNALKRSLSICMMVLGLAGWAFVSPGWTQPLPSSSRNILASPERELIEHGFTLPQADALIKAQNQLGVLIRKSMAVQFLLFAVAFPWIVISFYKLRGLVVSPDQKQLAVVCSLVGLVLSAFKIFSPEGFVDVGNSIAFVATYKNVDQFAGLVVHETAHELWPDVLHSDIWAIHYLTLLESGSILHAPTAPEQTAGLNLARRAFRLRQKSASEDAPWRLMRLVVLNHKSAEEAEAIVLTPRRSTSALKPERHHLDGSA